MTKNQDLCLVPFTKSHLCMYHFKLFDMVPFFANLVMECTKLHPAQLIYQGFSTKVCRPYVRSIDNFDVSSISRDLHEIHAFLSTK